MSTATASVPPRSTFVDRELGAVSGYLMIAIGVVLIALCGWLLASSGFDPDGYARAAAALRNPNAGEVLVSAAPGWEFADLGGGHHVGGGSHGSLAASDSEVPMLTVGLGEPPASITGIKGLVLEHFGVAPEPRPE